MIETHFPDYIHQINEFQEQMDRPILWLSPVDANQLKDKDFIFYHANGLFLNKFKTTFNDLKKKSLPELLTKIFKKDGEESHLDKNYLEKFNNFACQSKTEHFDYHLTSECTYHECTIVQHLKHNGNIAIIFEKAPVDSPINYKSLFNKIQTGMVVYQLENEQDDKTLKVVWINKSAEKMFDRPNHIYAGKYIDEISPTPRQYDIPRVFSDAIRFKSPMILPSFEYFINEKKLNLSIEIIPLGNNFLAASFTDVFNYKETEKQLKKSEKRFKDLFNNMNNAVAVFEVTQDGNDFIFLDINTKAEEIDKITKDKVIGRKVSHVFPTIKEFGLFNIFQNVYHTGKSQHFPITYYVDKRISGYRDNFVFKISENEIVSIYSDETEKKVEEQKRMELEKQLYFASKLATLGELSSGIGHEVNNPLAILQGHLEIIHYALSKKKETLEVYKTLEKNFQSMHQASRRIASVVRGLKNYAQGVRYQEEIFELKSCINNTFIFIKILYEKDGINFQLDLPEGPLFAKGDMGQFQQVLINLLNNARDAIEKSERKHIKLKLFQEQERAILQVSDNGEGIRPENIQKIFESFFTTKSKEKGTGLGLNIVKKIVSEMNGEISVASQLGQGATFTVNVPVTTPPPNKLKDYLKQENKEVTLISNDKKLTGKCLIVDVDKEMRSFMCEILENLGMETETVSSGILAMQKLKESTFDYIISDYFMPEMRGDQLISQILKTSNFKGRVFLISGATVEIKLPDDIKIDGIIERPFTANSLYQILAPKNS